MSVFLTHNSYKDKDDNYNYVESVIKQFIEELKISKKIKEKVGYYKKEELKLKFLDYDFSLNKKIGINVLIKFLKNDEFKNFNFDTIDLKGNFIDSENLSLILEYLNENPFITKLNLSRNYLAINELKLKLYPSISHYFNVNTTLKVLDLSKTTSRLSLTYDVDEYSKTKFMFIIEIMNAIKSNPNSSIEEINLSDNEIDEKCIYAISKMLETNKSLKKLDLSHNKFNGSLEILGKSLLLNQTLEDLNIYNIFNSNVFSNEELINFGFIIFNNYSLQEIYYLESFFENKIINIICKRNKKLVKSKEKMMNFMLAVRKQQIKKRIFPVELYDLIFSEYILTF